MFDEITYRLYNETSVHEPSWHEPFDERTTLMPDVTLRPRSAATTDAPTLLQWGCDRFDAVAWNYGIHPSRLEAGQIAETRILFDQLMPVRDRLPYLWRQPRHDDSRFITVVGTHMSKSVLLPVYCMRVPDVGVFYMRNNFHDWGISCELEFRVRCDMWGDLFDHEKTGSFYEGFWPEWKHEPLEKNREVFSLALQPYFEDLYAFMVVLRTYCITMGIVEPRL